MTRPNTQSATTTPSPSSRPRCNRHRETGTTPTSNTPPHAPATSHRTASHPHHARRPRRRSHPAAPTRPTHQSTPDPVSPSHPRPWVVTSASPPRIVTPPHRTQHKHPAQPHDQLKLRGIAMGTGDGAFVNVYIEISDKKGPGS